jgi:ferrous iron transport protein B
MPVTLQLPVASGTHTVALVGNPNTGKTTLFNVLTGFRQRVGNYPRVTVEKRSGLLRGADSNTAVEMIDLPGAYSLAAQGEDEAVLLEVLLGQVPGTRMPDVIICVVDASNLTRNLFLATQILEIGKPVVVALNMMDLARHKGLAIDVEGLAAELGVRVIPIVANKGIGLDKLREAIVQAMSEDQCRRCPDFPACVCAELDGLCASLASVDTVPRDGHGAPDSQGSFRQDRDAVSRVEALQTLLDPGGYHEVRLMQRCGRGLAEELAERRSRITAAGESIAEVEARVRYAWIEGVVGRVVTRSGSTKPSTTDRADRILLHPVAGLAVFLVIMALCFQAIYSWAGPLMEAIDGTFGVIAAAVETVTPEGALRSLLTDGVVAGVGAVLIFLPQILILFLFIAVLEDCGYMARAAFLLDRWMGRLGLNGQAFIPLVSSFACAVPGIMATRAIDDRRDRLVTILIAPLMSCSARLPVYVLLIAAFVPATPILGGLFNLQAATLLTMYLIGAVVAIPVAWLLKRFLVKGPAPSFLMELPSYKVPSIKTVLYRMYEQGRAFVVTAGTIIFASAIVIWALGYYPRSAWVAEKYETQRSIVDAEYETALAATRASTNNPHAPGEPSPDSADSASNKMIEQRLAELAHARAERLGEIDRHEAGEFLRTSFLGRMGRLIEPAVMPLGWDWRIGTAVIAAFPAREVIISAMGTIYNLGGDTNEESFGLRQQIKSATWPDGRPVFNLAVALSIMVFFALCCQCVSTLAVIQRETRSWRWPLVTFAYMTGLAYIAAWITYQVAGALT